MAGAGLMSPFHGAALRGVMQPLKLLAGRSLCRLGGWGFQGPLQAGSKISPDWTGLCPTPDSLYLGHTQLFLSNN